MKKFILLFFLFYSLFILNSYAVNIDSCQVLGAGSYTLNQSLTHSGSTCFSFSSPNVILDCQGYNLSISATSYGIQSSSLNVTIKNCNIYGGVQTGIYVISTNTNSIINNSIYNSRFGISLFTADNNIISQNVIVNASPSGVGIDLYSSSYNSIINNTIINSDGDGIEIDSAFTGEFNEIINNTITSATLNGIEIDDITSTSTKIIGNEISNSGTGISVASSNTNITNNVITGNTNGIFLGGLTYGVNHTTIFNNTITGNENYNIGFLSFDLTINTSIYANHLGDISKVYNNDWSNWQINFNSSSIGNTYYNTSGLGSGLTYCFDSPTNSICDYFATIIAFPEIIQATSSESFFSFSSFLIPLIMVFMYFIL